MTLSLATLWPLSFLFVAVVDDLLYKKFHNWLFITLTIIALSYPLFFSEITLLDSLGGFAAGAVLMLPLVLLGAMGAGDMKFMMSFGILMGTLATFEIFVFALFWGALIGVLQMLLNKKGDQLVSNLYLMFHKVKPSQTAKIPYTVAILFGWLTHHFYGGLL